MKLLLDTCALLALGKGSLPKKAAKCLTTAEEAWVPAVVAWEIAIKVKTGKLQLPDAPLPWIESLCARYSLDLQRQGPDTRHPAPLRRRRPAALHRDPFDRVLVATCLSLQLTILTSDRIIPTYPGVQVIW